MKLIEIFNIFLFRKLEEEILCEYKRKVTFLKDVVRSEETVSCNFYEKLFYFHIYYRNFACLLILICTSPNCTCKNLLTYRSLLEVYIPGFFLFITISLAFFLIKLIVQSIFTIPYHIPPQEDPLERILLCQHLLPTSVISDMSKEKGNENNGGSGTTKGLHLQMKGKHKKDLRKQLLGIIAFYMVYFLQLFLCGITFCLIQALF